MTYQSKDFGEQECRHDRIHHKESQAVAYYYKQRKHSPRQPLNGSKYGDDILNLTAHEQIDFYEDLLDFSESQASAHYESCSTDAPQNNPSTKLQGKFGSFNLDSNTANINQLRQLIQLIYKEQCQQFTVVCAVPTMILGHLNQSLNQPVVQRDIVYRNFNYPSHKGRGLSLTSRNLDWLQRMVG
jgi:hypothetical protein